MKDGAHSTRTAAASLAAIVSVIAASSCCLPVLPFFVAAGLAGGSTWLTAARPYLLGLSILCIGYAFYQARRAGQCDSRPAFARTFLLWSSTLMVAVAVLFPQALADMSARLLQR